MWSAPFGFVGGGTWDGMGAMGRMGWVLTPFGFVGQGTLNTKTRRLFGSLTAAARRRGGKTTWA